MTPLTMCTAAAKAVRQALSVKGIVLWVLWMSLVTALSLLHVYVKFRISDYRDSIRYLQQRRQQLDEQANLLRIEVLKLESKEHTKSLAEQSGMKVASSNQIETQRLPRELAMKYADREWRKGENLTPEPAARKGEDSALERVVAGIAGRIGESGGAGQLSAQRQALPLRPALPQRQPAAPPRRSQAAARYETNRIRVGSESNTGSVPVGETSILSRTRTKEAPIHPGPSGLTSLEF